MRRAKRTKIGVTFRGVLSHMKASNTRWIKETHLDGPIAGRPGGNEDFDGPLRNRGRLKLMRIAQDPPIVLNRTDVSI